MSELSPEARALLEAARADGAPTEADRARVERALAQVLAAPSAPVSPKPASKLALPQASGSVASAALKAVVVAVLAAVGAITIAAFSTRGSPRPAQRPPLVHAPPESPAPTVLLPAPSQPRVTLQEKQPGLVPIPAAQAPRFRPVQGKAPVFAPLDLREPAPAAAPAPAPAASPSPAVSDGQLAEELQLMSQAQLKLRSGDAAGAIERLDEHARSYPRGALSEERTAARVQALCALGRIPEARAEALQFLADHPGSPYAAKVRASCGGP